MRLKIGFILIFLVQTNKFLNPVAIFNKSCFSALPNLFVGSVQNSALYSKWYFEVAIDHVEQMTSLPPHFRVGWANTAGYVPYPGGGEKWGGE